MCAKLAFWHTRTSQCHRPSIWDRVCGCEPPAMLGNSRSTRPIRCQSLVNLFCVCNINRRYLRLTYLCQCSICSPGHNGTLESRQRPHTVFQVLSRSPYVVMNLINWTPGGVWDWGNNTWLVPGHQYLRFSQNRLLFLHPCSFLFAKRRTLRNSQFRMAISLQRQPSCLFTRTSKMNSQSPL